MIHQSVVFVLSLYLSLYILVISILFNAILFSEGLRRNQSQISPAIIRSYNLDYART